jgi:uncharacterized protein YdeI (YjbR/CyaY-like superfamily)
MKTDINAFFDDADTWQDEFRKLRSIMLDFNLAENLKWGKPCYSLEGRNIALIHGFKEYCAILFIDGALLKDPHGVLVAQTDKVQAGRQIRFTNLAEIAEKEKAIRDCVREAIDVAKSGQKVERKETKDFPVPDEFRACLDADRAFREAFESLTPGRQRAYLLYFAGAKQAQTRIARIEKNRDRILDGLGLDD